MQRSFCNHYIIIPKNESYVEEKPIVLMESNKTFMDNFELNNWSM